MVDLMNECQGDVLRKLAEVVRPIVEGIYLQTISASDRFAIEDVQRDDIVRYPKGAPELLELFSKRTLSPSAEPEI